MGQFWWYLARASGIVAWSSLTASVLWGVVLSTRAFPRHHRRAWLTDLHRWLGALTVGFVVLHVGSIVADSYVHFGTADVLVPFASSWKPAAVALGIVSAWLLVVVQLTSLAMRWLPRRVWHGIHLTSYVTFWATCLHGVLAGTDASNSLYLGSAVVVMFVTAFATAYRVLKDRAQRAQPPPRPRTPPAGPWQPVPAAPPVGARSVLRDPRRPR
jgi:hypothetical protein